MSILVVIGLLVAAYLFGAIPFGYLVGRARGVNLFEQGSKNIGATNVGRVLGRPYAVLVFLLDFAKGALPVAVIVPIASAVDSEAPVLFGSTDWLRIGAAGVAFLGHLFPVYLGFRGGKGVATGAGVAFILVPGPMRVGPSTPRSTVTQAPSSASSPTSTQPTWGILSWRPSLST